MENFKQLIAGIPIEYLQVASEIIEMAEKELDCKLNDVIYISLTDHINMAVYRIRNFKIHLSKDELNLMMFPFGAYKNLKQRRAEVFCRVVTFIRLN